MASCCHSPQPATATSTPWHRHLRLGLAILMAGLSMTLSLALNLDPPTGPTRTLLHTILAGLTGLGLVALGWPILRAAWEPRLKLEHLYLLGLVGAYSASLYSSLSGVGHIYYEVVLILLAIYHLGQFVLGHHVRQAESLAHHIPGIEAQARRIDGPEVRLVPAREVPAGSRIRVEPGELVPVDGVVTVGRAFVEELAHTGEPFPAVREPGAALLAGSRVLDGSLELQTTRPGDQRELDRLLAACRESGPSPAENLAQRVLAAFVPTVVLVTLATAAYWTLIARSPGDAIFHALAVTIVACPCALGLAIPIASRRALLQLRLLGVVAQTPDLVERLAKVDTVAFDKTGTLSHPRLVLERLTTEPGAPSQLGAWLAAIQRHSTHPVARPFWDLAPPAELPSLRLKYLPARGIEATFLHRGQTTRLQIGNDQLVESPEPPDPTTRRLHVLVDGRQVACAQLRESPRAQAIATLERLQQQGLRRILLTGDSSCPAAYTPWLECHTTRSVGQKAAILREHRHRGHATLFVGDGLNDTEGLRAADVGIALQSGSRPAQAAAHGLLSHDDLSVLPDALQLARRAKRRLVRLLAFSLIYNALGIGLAATGQLHPVAAALLMFASSITVLTIVNRAPHPARLPADPAAGRPAPPTSVPPAATCHGSCPASADGVTHPA